MNNKIRGNEIFVFIIHNMNAQILIKTNNNKILKILKYEYLYSL